MSNTLAEPERRTPPNESTALASGRGQFQQPHHDEVQDRNKEEEKDHYPRTSATGRLALLLSDALDGMDKGAADWLGPLPPGGPEAIRAAVRTSGFGCLPESGADPYEVLKSLSRLLAWGAADPAHPHCVAHLHTPPLAVSVAAETVTAALNQSLDSWDQSPVAGEIEQAVIETLAASVGYQCRTSSGVLTSGGTESNLMGLLLARDEALRHRYDVDPDLDGIPAVAAGRLRILTSELAHFSIARNAALLGIGERSVVPIETDNRGRMRPDKAAQALSRIDDHDEIPMALVATAGTTDHGAIDPLRELAALAARRGTWFHVDAAYGGGLLLGGTAEDQDNTHHELASLSSADSITLDLHKLGWQPIPAGVFLVRRAAALRTLEKRVAYLNPLDDEQAGFPSLLGRSLRTTRRADAVKIAAAFATLGREGFADLIGGCRDLARYAAARIQEHPDLELTAEPVLTTVLFRFLPGPGTEPAPTTEPDHINAALRRHLLTTGKAVIGRTELPRPRPGTAPGRVRLKLTLLNPHTTERQIDELLELVCRAGRQAGASARTPAGERHP